MNAKISSGWLVKSISIEKQDYGAFEGQYTGIVKFNNNTGDAFTFRLTPSESDEFLAIIAGRLRTAASELSKTLIDSIRHLPPSTTNVVVDEQTELNSELNQASDHAAEDDGAPLHPY